MPYRITTQRRLFFKENAKYIPRLPEFEQVLIDCFMRNINQKEMAKFLGVTQGAISSRLCRSIRRISFIRRLDNFDLTDFDKDMASVCTKPVDLEIIKAMIQTTSQSQTATIVNFNFGLTGNEKLNQVKVRHRYLCCLEKLGQLAKKDLKYEKYFILLQFIKNNLYTLSELRHPHFNRN